ncbi:hypothetical protein [Vibrio cyclitrophicus]|nr:hypothetical protein [Vibrio cyclitrophicus]OEF30698.1 hypothetical protein OA9_20205 [Vibrio cyclitrophicus 1F97]OEF39551.1 hypothetical protein OAC_12380 [Vibrio cyclitrophicus 1F273]OEF79608.1 hypothetical protein OA5_02075 [Vibrio cyclitrophicus 1F111]
MNLDPYTVKVARTVLRGAALGNNCRLLDNYELEKGFVWCDHRAILLSSVSVDVCLESYSTKQEVLDMIGFINNNLALLLGVGSGLFVGMILAYLYVGKRLVTHRRQRES